MDPIRDYLERTSSASRHIFHGIDELVGPLRHHRVPLFVGWGESPEPYRQWLAEHENEVRESLAIQEKYAQELFAIATLCGAILQIAFHAFQLCSTHAVVPDALKGVIREDAKAVKFCAGRTVKGVPLGIIVYVGRNQHMHFEDAKLQGVSKTLFQLILEGEHERDLSRLVADEHMLIGVESGTSLAKAFMDLMRWHSYEAYEQDMVRTLEQV
ncbi:MAG: hypothetical protein IPK64_01255 [bacterium]|nr:hypothetical protein [bacterium]